MIMHCAIIGRIPDCDDECRIYRFRAGRSKDSLVKRFTTDIYRDNGLTGRDAARNKKDVGDSVYITAILVSETPITDRTMP